LTVIPASSLPTRALRCIFVTTVSMFILAAVAALFAPLVGLAIIVLTLALYVRPETATSLHTMISRFASRRAFAREIRPKSKNRSIEDDSLLVRRSAPYRCKNSSGATNRHPSTSAFRLGRSQYRPGSRGSTSSNLVGALERRSLVRNGSHIAPFRIAVGGRERHRVVERLHNDRTAPTLVQAHAERGWPPVLSAASYDHQSGIFGGFFR
jgi:hypothetical protein